MLVVVVGAEADSARALRDAGAEILVADEDRAAALADLGRRGITSLFLEGGPTLAGAFAAAGEVDESRVFVAPRACSAARGAPRPPSTAGAERRRLIETRFKEW